MRIDQPGYQYVVVQGDFLLRRAGLFQGFRLPDCDDFIAQDGKAVTGQNQPDFGHGNKPFRVNEKVGFQTLLGLSCG